MEIKKVFKRHGFTQAQVAERMGITRGALASCISRGTPTPTTLHRIAEAIGADYSEFFEDEEYGEHLLIGHEQRAIKQLRSQIREKSTDVIPASALEGTIEGGIIILGGRRYKQIFIPE